MDAADKVNNCGMCDTRDGISPEWGVVIAIAPCHSKPREENLTQDFSLSLEMTGAGVEMTPSEGFAPLLRGVSSLGAVRG